jgi:hypothetical protein
MVHCRMPFLYCPDCQDIALPNFTASLIRLRAEQGRNNQQTIMFADFNESQKRFGFCKKLNLKYDSMDYYFIPGLYRPSQTGFLTPVLFEKDALTYFIHHPKYTVSLPSNSYGNIRSRTDTIIAFGINRSGKLIMWLGDLDGLDERDQLVLAAHNVASDHDVASEFYEGQIEVEFTDYSREEQVLRNATELANNIFAQFGIKLFQLEQEAKLLIPHVLPPIHFTEGEMGDSAEDFTKLLIERIDSNSLKEDLRQLLPVKEFKDLKQMRGLKTLQRWLQARGKLVSADTLLIPLFVLYDLRVIYKHLVSEDERSKTRASCLVRLGLPPNADDRTLYETVLDRAAESFAKLSGLLRSISK